MKGLSHFVAGLAVASCFPESVRAGAASQPALFLLGGIAGLLPDTLDFRFVRFLYRHDMEVVPDPARPDPGMIAEAIAYAIERARLTRKPVRIKLHTIQQGAGRWQPYTVRLDTLRRRVVVAYEAPATVGSTAGGERARRGPKPAERPVACAFTPGYEAVISVDILDGPVLKMVPAPDGGPVRVEFLPWHRRWSHNLPAAALFAGVAGLGWGVSGTLIVFGAYAAHVLCDQLGFMGSALLFPFRKKRVQGLQLMHAMAPFANFGCIWACCVLIFWNLWRAAPGVAPPPNLLQILVFAIALPLALLRWAAHRLARAQLTVGP